MGIWPNFRSPLIWDVFAISTYATVSMLFWFIGLIPDLATLRDRRRAASGASSTGSRDGLARLGAPLAEVRDGVAAARGALDAAGRLRPLDRQLRLRGRRRAGWHATIFPPYFVAGAIYAGFAMVLTLAIPLRKIYGLEDLITMRHLNYMGRVMLATGLIVATGTRWRRSWPGMAATRTRAS